GLCKTIEESGKIVIAAVNGYALGGGCELALACDIRIASNTAKFGLPELNLGIIPGGGGTQRLSRIIGKGRALDMILTGAIINADRAEHIGLVSKVVPSELLLEETMDYTKSIVSKGPLALKLVKAVVHQGFDLNLEAALKLEKLTQAIVFESEDKLEGTTAFLEKRESHFVGK
ncbi:MAG: enoyl-CoA hydratase-related protein, partial [Solibacillus isronensis]